MGDIRWTLPRTEVTSRHKLQVMMNLTEAGIKLFLHQRNQIPVPMEHLSRETKTEIKTNPSQKVVLPSDENISRSSGNDATEDKPRTAITLPSDYVDPRIRIRQLVGSRRRNMLDKSRTNTEQNRVSKESDAYNSITKLFQTLKDECASLPVPLQAVVLVLGPSVIFPSEVVVFDFKNVDLHAPAQQFQPQDVDISTMCRSYYKAIIMSDAFLELTDKPLFATKASLYLFVKERLPFKLNQKLMLIDSVPWIKDLFKSDTLTMKTFKKTQGPRVRNLRKKRTILRICITESGVGSAGNVQNGGSIMQDNISISEDNVFIPPNNSFCYQIPCYFKGLHCKKKQ